MSIDLKIIAHAADADARYIFYIAFKLSTVFVLDFGCFRCLF